MKKVFIFLWICTSLPVLAQPLVPDASLYGIAFWDPDSLGNHRAVVHVTEPSDAVRGYPSLAQT